VTKFIPILLFIIIIFPLLSLFYYLFLPAQEIWAHLRSTVLNIYIFNTLFLSLSVMLCSAFIAVPLAWLTTKYHFPGKNIFEWALFLPFAIPSYLLAYIYYSVKDNFITINSYLAAIIIMSLSLYPYVFLFSKQVFKEISPTLIYASKTLNQSELKTFWKVILLLSRPAIFSGMLLVYMETIGDFGTVDFFSIDTLATGIFRTWFGLGSITGAIQISFILFTFSIALVVMESFFRKKMVFYQKQIPHNSYFEKNLNGVYKYLAFILCLVPILISFILPLIILFMNLYQLGMNSFNKEFFEIAFRSFKISSIGAVLCIFIGMVFSVLKRIHSKNKFVNLYEMICFGYAIPGAIIAISVLTSFKILDNLIESTTIFLFHFEFKELILSGTVFAVLYAYSIRFTSISFQSANASMNKISPSIEWASKTLGKSIFETGFKIYFPLLKNSFFISFIIIFVDIIKELPATMVLRPFNYETMSIKTYNLASDERLKEASAGALFIILLGIIPVILIYFYNQKKKL
jgi:iron(III) transport system permease protein